MVWGYGIWCSLDVNQMNNVKWTPNTIPQRCCGCTFIGPNPTKNKQYTLPQSVVLGDPKIAPICMVVEKRFKLKEYPGGKIKNVFIPNNLRWIVVVLSLCPSINQKRPSFERSGFRRFIPDSSGASRSRFSHSTNIAPKNAKIWAKIRIWIVGEKRLSFAHTYQRKAQITITLIKE